MPNIFKKYPTQKQLKTWYHYLDSGWLVHKHRPDRSKTFNNRYCGKIAGTQGSYNRWRINIEGGCYEAHRIIWIWHFGDIPKGQVIDHIDGNSMNNRIDNLRVGTTSNNNANRKQKSRNATSQYFGVSWNSKRKLWIAQAKKDGKVHYIGSFENEVDAAVARDDFNLELHGEFATLNFPSC